MGEFYATELYGKDKRSAAFFLVSCPSELSILNIPYNAAICIARKRKTKRNEGLEGRN